MARHGGALWDARSLAALGQGANVTGEATGIAAGRERPQVQVFGLRLYGSQGRTGPGAHPTRAGVACFGRDGAAGRSTEGRRFGDTELSLIHISEPTRLGMISYAVFCLKKKKKTT